jgi:two-component system CitB family response regulator
MIRVIVVEDDYRIAELHREFTERVEGFCVIGLAHTGAEALGMVDRMKPDLVLLDIYLPDISGIDVLQELRGPRHPAVDVIAVTAAKDVATLRAAMHGGVLQYLVKPFRANALEERLRSYAAVRERMRRLHEADQREVDRVFGLLRAGAGERLPKGLSGATLDLVIRALGDAQGSPSAEEVAQLAGISRVTARRYLDHLAQMGRVELTMRYGAPGRPEHRYRLAGER